MGKSRLVVASSLPSVCDQYHAHHGSHLKNKSPFGRSLLRLATPKYLHGEAGSIVAVDSKGCVSTISTPQREIWLARRLNPRSLSNLLIQAKPDDCLANSCQGCNFIKGSNPSLKCKTNWWTDRDSNSGHSGCKPDALAN